MRLGTNAGVGASKLRLINSSTAPTRAAGKRRLVYGRLSWRVVARGQRKRRKGANSTMIKSQNVRRRLGFTLLEIMTSVTLALMLMYAVARIFSRVGGAMNETTSTMEMTNALRNAKNRLTLDLESISTTPAPPRNSRSGEGYLCYVEGLGGSFTQVAQHGPFAVGDIALDAERFQAKPNSTDSYDYCDNTIGDLDDILSFTAKAPDGQAFRGRYIEPIYDVDANGNSILVGGRESTFESQHAEIIWFVRGTTLYRRVLPLMSDKALQDSFDALRYASLNGDDNLAGVAYQNVRQGFGFFRFYDVSVHMGANGRLVANTLGDLTNRANRYFYWNTCGLELHPSNPQYTSAHALNIHGDSGAWYWLRMATLQESAAPNFRAGAPFGENANALDSITPGSAGSNLSARSMNDSGSGEGYGTGGGNILGYWAGATQALTLSVENGETRLDGGAYSCGDLPLLNNNVASRFPFLDYWNAPNPWSEVNYETGDLSTSAVDFATNSYKTGNGDDSNLLFNQDVILTNVISFNVKAWDPKVCAYVDLGSGVQSGESTVDDPNDLRSYGYYGKIPSLKNPNTQGENKYLWLPCVYDTWTEQYQRGLYLYTDYCNASGESKTEDQIADPGATLTDVDSEGFISASQLKDYPPPYNTRLNSLQIEIRVFDPRSKHIRNATFDVDLSSL